MTKEELEKEAEEYADKHAFRVPYDGSNKFYDDVDFKASKEGYVLGAEPREKQIQIDAEQIRALQKQNGELTDKVNDLEDNQQMQTISQKAEIMRLGNSKHRLRKCRIAETARMKKSKVLVDILHKLVGVEIGSQPIKEIKEK